MSLLDPVRALAQAHPTPFGLVLLLVLAAVVLFLSVVTDPARLNPKDQP